MCEGSICKTQTNMHDAYNEFVAFLLLPLATDAAGLSSSSRTRRNYSPEWAHLRDGTDGI